MPHTVDEKAEKRAERLEREAEDAIADGFRDLIWPLLLWIEALRWMHHADSALEAARLGERRLALRRVALAGAPDELACSVRELMDLYTFENDSLDPRRADELRCELAARADTGGAGQEV